eukprot:8564649-Ditylum_brightwellii.AAC.1
MSLLLVSSESTIVIVGLVIDKVLLVYEKYAASPPGSKKQRVNTVYSVELMICGTKEQFWQQWQRR